MAHTVEFERCVDFLARMIEKYGSELLQELNGLPKSFILHDRVMSINDAA